MPTFNSIKTKWILPSILCISIACTITSCVTPAQKEAMQANINELEESVNKLREKIAAQLKQMDHTTRTTLSSQSELQNMQNQLQDNLGEIDALKTRIKKIEEISSTNWERYTAQISANEHTIIKLERQVARLELNATESSHALAASASNPSTRNSSANSATNKFKTTKDVSKFLKKEYEKGNFKTVIQQSTAILQSAQSTSDMLAAALEFRAEAKFQLADYRGTVIDLTNYLEQYPHAEKSARALLLLGDSYVYLKNQSVAVSYYNDCIKMYGSTTEGSACSARISKIGAL